MAGNLKQALGLKIRAARQRAALTQEALAAQVRRSSESISNIERGQQLPSIDTIIDLAQALGLPIAELFEDYGEIIPTTGERGRLEARLRELARTLSDIDLSIAVEQIAVLARVRGSR